MKIQKCLRYRKQRFPIPLLHRWRRPTPAERACSSPAAGEKGKGKQTELPADQRCRPAGFDFQQRLRDQAVGAKFKWSKEKPAESGQWLNAHVPKAGGNRRVVETTFDERQVRIRQWGRFRSGVETYLP
ncbi:Hypothetical_protein [Hexamita inflata]|uniref:Hypothetical_protein n=1 Tax=Hexamita inflata TaxID=28002 RepID=A0AA86RCL9_9EUKA|nr:Hypothetical protein HINF_LOCUS63379 [Hexamita inflata]